MSYFEFTGKNVKEAIAKACVELETEEALLEVNVIAESTRGFLGIVGQRDARIRVKRRDILKEVMEVDNTPEPVESVTAPQTEKQSSAIEEPISVEPTEESVEEVEEYHPELERACNILKEILDRIPVEVEIHGSVKGGVIYLDIQGDKSGLLIGKRGQTLDSLQHLMNKILNRDNINNGKL